ncbi:MAG TPA: putative sulfate exporter family transporter [Acidimicrobiales bacterium]|nr:putative sulfate exporter family transporter [Acidimicrobiales bacterium]
MTNELAPTTSTSTGAATPSKVTTTVGRARAIGPGLVAAGGLAVVATLLGNHFRIVGAPVFAILSGIALSLFIARDTPLHPGLSVASKSVLKGSVIVLGTGLSFREVVTTGGASIPVLLGSLTIALGGAWLVGRWLNVPGDLTTLIGVGTAICGASAIAATDAVIAAPEADVSYAITTIFTFNIAAVLTFPAIGHVLHMSPHTFGLWSGTAINDMSSVVAASAVYAKSSMSYAVIVKLTRTLMIIPIVLALSLWRSSHQPGAPTSHLRRIRRAFPLFIAWFLVTVLANSLNIIPANWHGFLGDLAGFMITTAMAAIGLSSNVRAIARTGVRPLFLGAVLWFLVSSSSLALQVLSGGHL